VSAPLGFPPVQIAVASARIILDTDIRSCGLNRFVGDVFERYQNAHLLAALSLIDRSITVGRPVCIGGPTVSISMGVVLGADEVWTCFV